ncbi:MAG: hypothetical protein DRG30_01320 [Epsilonproteobacteria bacterium]|nr:MAG: hypothetical protein DRG30_01320 [Campylobacterota bacterium]
MHANTPTALITKCNQGLINKKLIDQNRTIQTREETLNRPTRQSIQKETDQLHTNPVQIKPKTRGYKALDSRQENEREITNNLITKIKETNQRNGTLLKVEKYEALANNLNQDNKESLDKRERIGKATQLAQWKDERLYLLLS